MPVRIRNGSASTAALWLALCGSLVAGRAGAAEPTKAQCIAANETAQDLRGSGKLIEARTQLAVCVAESCPGAVRQDCAQRLADLDKALPTLVLVSKDSAGNDLVGVRATIDGKAVDGLNGTAIPLDPGEHHIVLQAAGLPDTAKTLVLHEGEKARREVVTFAATPPASASAVADTGTPPQAPAPEPADAASAGDTQRKVGIVVGGVGAVGVILGGIFGLVAKGTYDHAINSECTGTVCNAGGVADVHSAYGQATVSNVGFIAGAVILGAGAYVFLSAPRAGAISVGPTAGTDGAGMTVRGTW
jgi:hypothetical protein